jgi:hypothetical protein
MIMLRRLVQSMARVSVLCLLLGFTSNAFAYYDCGWYGPNFEWECWWYPDPPVPNGDEAQVQQERYYLKSGDLNGDGKTDFLVTGADILRRVQDFIVLSNSGGYQTIPCYLLPLSQQTTVANWPILNSPVSRVDISLDGYFDFVLDEVEGGDSLAVITNSSDGRTPVAATVINDGVRQAAAEIQRAIEHPQDTLAQYDWSATYYIEYWFWYDPCWYESYSCGFWYPVYYPYTVYGADAFTPAARDFISDNRLALTDGTLASAFTSTAWAGYGAGAVTGLGAAVLDSPLGMRLGWFAVSAAIMGSGPVVAAMGRPALAVVVVGTVGAGVWYVANEVFSDPAPSDTGSVPTTTPANPDPFDPCNRDTSVYQETPDDRRISEGGTVSESALRAASKRNLERTGCGKPQYSHAHHGIPLNANPSGVGARLRAWAQQNNVNLTSEANQVYLPSQPNAASRAVPHNHQLHTQKALEELERRIAVRQSQGMSARDALRSTLEEMARGTFKW